MPFTGNQAVTGPGDGTADALVQNTQFHIGHGAGLFCHGQGFDKLWKMPDQHAGDREILRRPRRVHAIVSAVRQRNAANRVCLDAGTGHGFSF